MTTILYIAIAFLLASTVIQWQMVRRWRLKAELAKDMVKALMNLNRTTIAALEDSEEVKKYEDGDEWKGLME